MPRCAAAGAGGGAELGAGLARVGWLEDFASGAWARVVGRGFGAAWAIGQGFGAVHFGGLGLGEGEGARGRGEGEGEPARVAPRFFSVLAGKFADSPYFFAPA